MKIAKLIIFAIACFAMVVSRNHRGKLRNENENDTENEQFAKGVLCGSVRCAFASQRYCCNDNSSGSLVCSSTPCE